MTITYTPVANGVYEHNGSIICVGSLPNQLAVSQKKARMNIWVGELPPNWRLCEGMADAESLAVPVEDIERLLRASEWTLGVTREGNLLLRRVQRWLDSLPREVQAANGNP